MKSITFPAAIIALFCAGFTTALSAATPGDSTLLQETVLLKRGTVITLQVEEELTTKDVEEDDLVSLSVYDDVTVNGAVVLHSGLFGQARVTRVRKPGGFGRPGELSIEAINVETTDGQRIRLEGNPVTDKGRSNKGAAMGVGLVIPAAGVVLGAPILLPFAAVGLLVKGKDGVVESRTQINAVVADDVIVRR